MANQTHVGIVQQGRGALAEWRKTNPGVHLDLSEAYLREADLREADLLGADLRGAYLRGADLLGADLREADLRGADLLGADLSMANLQRARLDAGIAIRQIGPLGSRHDYMTAVLTPSSEEIRVGCWHGTLDELEVRVRGVHGDNPFGREYRAAIAYLRAAIQVHLRQTPWNS